MKPTRNVAGICAPTTLTVGPSVAVSAYAGATEESASATLPTIPTASRLRPLSTTPDAGAATVSVLTSLSPSARPAPIFPDRYARAQ